MPEYESKKHDCDLHEDDVVAAEEETGDAGCPVCGLGPDEHPPTSED